ncbi:hypothetical protein SDC9_63894 [bioreactor metagenome]|uniref:Uncharacterized protein n=1 Tax=bioreactor metagenome TaxID=1076179 RepID=A0A644XMY7_9ZZZZ
MFVDSQLFLGVLALLLKLAQGKVGHLVIKFDQDITLLERTAQGDVDRFDLTAGSGFDAHFLLPLNRCAANHLVTQGLGLYRYS